MFYRIQKTCFNRFNTSFLLAQRNFVTGPKYQGYVNYYNAEKGFGFIIREDLPENEYYFDSGALITDQGIPRVRPLQPVEFQIVEHRGNGNQIARDITAIGGSFIQFSHPNLRLPPEKRKKKLSDLPHGLHERHGGIINRYDEERGIGFILPDRLNYNNLVFNRSELQTTGVERIEKFSEVEFFVHKTATDLDRALCITRKGGGLITAETKELGQFRRIQGSIYGPDAINATIKPEFAKNRQRGYVVMYNDKKLYGFIQGFANTDEAIFFTIDDCHISGKRALHRFQEVEFSITQNEGKMKAVQITGPNKTVLRFISENRYIPSDARTIKLKEDNTTVYSGNVVKTAPNNFLILPNQKGAQVVFAFYNHVWALGSKKVSIGDHLQFTIVPEQQQQQQQQQQQSLQRAENISGGGRKPLIIERGDYGKYLAARMNLPTTQDKLEEHPLTDNTLTGFVSSFSSQNKKGLIEIIAPEGERYRKIIFMLDDAILPDDTDPQQIFIRSGIMVEFNIAAITDDDNNNNNNDNDNNNNIIKKKATHVKSKGSQYLNVSLNSNRQQGGEQEDNTEQQQEEEQEQGQEQDQEQEEEEEQELQNIDNQNKQPQRKQQQQQRQRQRQPSQQQRQSSQQQQRQRQSPQQQQQQQQRQQPPTNIKKEENIKYY